MKNIGYADIEAPKPHRIHNIIERNEKIAQQAEDLAGRLEVLANRTIGARPIKEEAAMPTALLNGTLQQLEELERRIGRALEHIRNELGELESAL